MSSDDVYDESKLSGRMSGWLCATAKMGGEDYVATRVVGFLDACRANMRDGEAETPSQQRLHVPTVSFPYDVNDEGGIKNFSAVAEKVMEMVRTSWPALSDADAEIMDQYFSAEWGGETDGKSNAVTRFIFDFGDVDELPEIEFAPGTRPDFTRDPVTWVKAKDIAYSGADVEGAYWDASAYSLSAPYPVAREVKDDSGTITLAEDVIAEGSIFQETVADTYKERFGVEFFAKPARPDLKNDGLSLS